MEALGTETLGEGGVGEEEEGWDGGLGEGSMGWEGDLEENCTQWNITCLEVAPIHCL